MEIIIKKYEHFNRSLPNWDTPKGKYISSERQYREELAKAGMKEVNSFGQVNSPSRKDYKLSKKANEIIETARNSKNSRGEVQLSGRTIEAMKEIGAINKEIPSYMRLPEHYQKKGGFI